MINTILRWMHRKTANLKSSSVLIPSLILSPVFLPPFILSLDIRPLACWTGKTRNCNVCKGLCTRLPFQLENRRDGITRYVRLSMCIRLHQVRVLLTLGVLNLKEQFGQTTSLLNTRPLCYKRLQLMCWFFFFFPFCFTESQNLAHLACMHGQRTKPGASRGVSRSSTVAC